MTLGVITSTDLLFAFNNVVVVRSLRKAKVSNFLGWRNAKKSRKKMDESPALLEYFEHGIHA